MISTVEIKNINHYNWWFNDEFKLRKNYKIEISNDKKFIFGIK